MYNRVSFPQNQNPDKILLREEILNFPTISLYRITQGFLQMKFDK